MVATKTEKRVTKQTAKRTATPRARGIPKGGLTDEHKAAMRQGRQEAAAVRKLLRSMGLKENPMEALLEAQKQIDEERKAEARKEELVSTVEDFTEVLEAFAERRGISREAFERVGVPTELLDAANLG